MKSSYPVSLLAGMAVAFVGAASAAEMQDRANGAAGMRASISTPHFKPSGIPVSAKRGEAIFLDHCALCHGLHGKGDGPRSAFFDPNGQYIPDMTNPAVLAGRDKQLIENIGEGLRRLPEPSYVMPQFKYILSDEEIRSVLAYVKTLAGTSKK